MFTEEIPVISEGETIIPIETPKKRGRGRPKGSKNKAKVEEPPVV